MLLANAIFLSLWIAAFAQQEHIRPHSNIAIRCLECNSRNNSMCLDPTKYDEETIMRNIPIIECGRGVQEALPGQYFCRKIVQTIFHKGYEPDIRVTRSCGWVRHRLACYRADNADHLETVCQCFTDQCNGAASVTAALTLGITVGSVALIGINY